MPLGAEPAPAVGGLAGSDDVRAGADWADCADWADGGCCADEGRTGADCADEDWGAEAGADGGRLLVTGGRTGAAVAGRTCGDVGGRTCGRAGAEDAELDGPEEADGAEDCDGDADFNPDGGGEVVTVGRAPGGRTRVVASSLAPDELAEPSPGSFDFTSAASVVIGAAPPPGL